MNIALKLMSAELYGKANQYYEFGEELLLRVTMKCAETVRDVCFRVEIRNSFGGECRFCIKRTDRFGHAALEN